MKREPWEEFEQRKSCSDLNLKRVASAAVRRVVKDATGRTFQ